MRAVVQRVTEARVNVADKVQGKIDAGILVYLGVGRDDDTDDVQYLAEKIGGLRIFRDDKHPMNRSVLDVGGSALVISQFTLHGDVRRGKRPSFIEACAPDEAKELYTEFIERLEQKGVPCQQGIFGAMMEVYSVNDGPVTILLDSKKLF